MTTPSDRNVDDVAEELETLSRSLSNAKDTIVGLEEEVKKLREDNQRLRGALDRVQDDVDDLDSRPYLIQPPGSPFDTPSVYYPVMDMKISLDMLVDGQTGGEDE